MLKLYFGLGLVTPENRAKFLHITNKIKNLYANPKKLKTPDAKTVVLHGNRSFKNDY